MVVLNWLVSDTNNGIKTNIALITETENGANYEETTTEDNVDRAIVHIVLEQTEENIIEPQVDVKDDEQKPEMIVPKDTNTTKKKTKSTKTGDEVLYYLVAMAVAGVLMVISIKKKYR